MTVTIDYDDDHDVLYVKDNHLEATYAIQPFAHESEHDGYFLTYSDSSNVVCCVTFIGAGALSQHDWIEHPDRGGLPRALRCVIDDWYAARQKAAGESK